MNSDWIDPLETAKKVRAMKEDATQNPSPATTERKGLYLCCMITAERYGDSQRGNIPEGTTITCDKCGQEVVSTGGQAWKAK